MSVRNHLYASSSARSKAYSVNYIIQTRFKFFVKLFCCMCAFDLGGFFNIIGKLTFGASIRKSDFLFFYKLNSILGKSFGTFAAKRAFGGSRKFGCLTFIIYSRT